MVWSSDFKERISIDRARRAARKLRSRLAPPPREVPVAPAPDLTPPRVGLFRDIDIAPHHRRDLGHPPSKSVIRSLHSGPIWPDFASRSWERHNIDGRPFDEAPEPLAGPVETLDQPALWIGYAAPHFGHLIAEHVTRVLWSRTLRPDDICLMTAAPDPRGQPMVPRYIWEVLAKLGLPRRQVRIVDRPLRVRELRVLPQAEQHVQPGPDAAYLDLLDRQVARSGLKPIPSETLYVARLGLLARRTGAHAGERYLVERLRAAGVSILDPAIAPLNEQLARYAGARNLVFAEGSAAHGRQLLGRLDQRITVINRRNGRRMAEALLTPRCTGVTYVEAVRAWCAPIRDNGEDHEPRAVSFYDVDALMAGFAPLGIDLASGWNAAAYRAACETDVATWVTAVQRDPTVNAAATLARLDAVPAGPAEDASGSWHRSLAS